MQIYTLNNDDYTMKIRSFASIITLLKHHFYFYENDIYDAINDNSNNNLTSD